MKAVASAPGAAAVGSGSVLLPFLRQVHADWRDEARTVLEPARHPGAGIWIRWTAVRYLNTAFSERLTRELAALNGVRACLGAKQENRLWALSELLELLGTHAEYQTGLCQREAEFAGIADRLLRALDLWCEEVEQDLGHLRWDDLTEDSRRAFSAIASEAQTHGA